MSIYTYAAVFIILVWSTVHSTSFGIWTWKEKNKSGAIMVFVLAAVSSLVPLTIFFLKLS